MRAIVVALAALCLLALPTTAEGNRGTIKVHESMDADPDRRNEPHVACDFWLEGFGMQHDSGELVFYEWAPTGDKGVVTPTGDSLDWTGTEDEQGFHFLNGPYRLPEGHYRVEAFSDGGHPGGEHFSKTKTFWVEPCEDVPEACPPVDLIATTNADGSIAVDVVTEAEFTLMRNGDVLGTFVGSQSYLDTNTTVGETYTYEVVVGEDVCASMSVTSIPVFPSLLAGGAAVTLGLLGYAFARRR